MTFQVDPVEPARERLPVRPLRERVGDCLALAGGEGRDTIETGGVHPLLAAVHLAFSEHRPLVLGPEAIALTMTQGVALHVRLQAEEVRPRFVRHQGRETLELRMQSLPQVPEDWAPCVLQLRDLLVDEAGPGWGRFFGCRFSTSTPSDEVAAAVVMLDAFSSYYDYLATGICGIPEVTLRGTPADWEDLRERVEILPELGLARWADSLRPILDGLVQTSRGEPDLRFWQEIYKPRMAYGGEQIAGWVGRLFPYVGSRGRYDRPNPMLQLPHGELVTREPGAFHEGIGSITTASVPSGPSSAALTLCWPDGRTGAVTLQGGLLGVEQDGQGRLVPFAGFVVREGSDALHELEAVIDRMIAEHHTEPARTDEPWQGSAYFAVLYGRMRSAVLEFGAGRWVMPPHTDPLPQVRDVSDPYLTAWPIFELPEGQRLASCRGRWVILPASCREPDAAASAQLAEIQERFDEGVLTHEEVRRARSYIAFAHPLRDVQRLKGELVDILRHALDHDGDLSALLEQAHLRRVW